MKLSKVTTEILKNFAQINQGLVFKEGNELRTMNVMKNIFATAVVPDMFPNSFAIYDLNEFLPAYSLLNDCDVDFQDNMLVLQVPGNNIEYPYSSPSVVVSPGDRNIRLPSEDKKFVLTREVFSAIQRSAAVLKLEDIVIDCTGITVLNKKAKGNSHHISLNVECGQDNSGENSFIKVENLKLMPLDYDVSICQKGLARFTSRSEEYKIEYHISLEMIS